MINVVSSNFAFFSKDLVKTKLSVGTFQRFSLIFKGMLGPVIVTLILIISETNTKIHHSHGHVSERRTRMPRDKKHLQSPFLDSDLNNTMIVVSTGEDLTLNCRVDRFQVLFNQLRPSSPISNLYIYMSRSF